MRASIIWTADAAAPSRRHVNDDKLKRNYFGSVSSLLVWLSARTNSAGKPDGFTAEKLLFLMNKGLLHATAISVLGWIVIVASGYLMIRSGLSPLCDMI